MGNIRIVTMRFDLANAYDASTYQRLAESAQRGQRRSRSQQAHFLTSVMLGVRPFGGLRNAGLTELPQFTSELDEQLDRLHAELQQLEGRMATKGYQKQNRGPVLRLVPASAQGNP